MKIYLAGKCKGKKWQLVQGIKNIEFISSDGISDYQHGYVCHSHDCYDWSDDNHIIYDSNEEIKKCDFMIAYIDSLDCYGTIAEIVTASMISKPVYLIINDKENEEEECIINGEEFKDAYWFVSNYPHVKRYVVNNFIESKKVVDNILSKYIKSIKLESPIEKQFWEVLNSYNINNYEVQYVIGRYRIDFAFPMEKICVELDGHDFHKTKEQRSYDNERDRFLQLQGWKVLRYTGSDIYNNCCKCVLNLKEHLINARCHLLNEEEENNV